MRTAQAVKEDAVMVLLALGSTDALVGASLRAHRVRGWPRDACECPVAVYLRGACDLPDNATVIIGRNHARIWLRPRPRGDNWPDVSVRLPLAVRTFVHRFDTMAGMWPGLLPERNRA